MTRGALRAQGAGVLSAALCMLATASVPSAGASVICVSMMTNDSPVLDGVTSALVCYIETMRSQYLERFLTLALYQWLRGCLTAEGEDLLQRIGLQEWLDNPDRRCVVFNRDQRCPEPACVEGTPDLRAASSQSTTCLFETHVTRKTEQHLNSKRRRSG